MEPSPSKQYIAVFLDADSRASLLLWWNRQVRVELLPNIIADHVTLIYDPAPEELLGVPVGEACAILVTGWAEDLLGQAVSVTGHFQFKNVVPHVTIATAAGIEAVYSNELLSRGVTAVSGPLLRGTYDIRRE